MNEPRPWNDRVFSKLLATYTPAEVTESRKQSMLDAMQAAYTSNRAGLRLQTGADSDASTRPQKRPLPFIVAGIAAAAVLVIVVGILIPRLPSATQSTGWISYATGSTTTPGGSDTASKPLAQNQKHDFATKTGETLVVERSGLRLELNEGSLLSILPGGLQATDGSKNIDRLELGRGSLLVEHTGQDPDFAVYTAHAIIQPIGTEFLVAVSDEGTLVRMLEGAVSVTLPDGRTERVQAPEEKLFMPVSPMQNASAASQAPTVPAQTTAAQDPASQTIASQNPQRPQNQQNKSNQQGQQNQSSQPGPTQNSLIPAANTTTTTSTGTNTTTTVRSSIETNPLPDARTAVTDSSNPGPGSGSAASATPPSPSASQLWKIASPLGGTGRKIMLTGDWILVASSRGLAGVSMSTGAVGWTRTEASEASALEGDRIFVRTASQMVAIHAQTGATLWQVPTPPVQSGSFSLSAGRILLGGADGRLLVLDQGSGSVLQEVQAEFGFFGTPLILNGRAYLKQLPQRIVAYTFDSGRLSSEPVQEFLAPARLGSGELGSRAGQILLSDTRSQWQALNVQTGEFSPASAPAVLESLALPQVLLAELGSTAQSIRPEQRARRGDIIVLYTPEEELVAWRIRE